MVQDNDGSESSIISSLKDLVDQDKQNVLGWNEDAVAVPLEDGFLILNTDSWVGSTDKPNDLSYFDCGYRALVNSASDIIAKGAKPKHAVASLSVPENNRNNVIDIVSGIVKACEENSIHYLGGDLNSAKDIVIDVTTWGYRKAIPVRRDGAKIGDNVYWLGPDLGETSAALGILVNNWNGDNNIALQIYGKPKLFFDFLGMQASSAIDCSDGLAKSLYFICEMSKVGINLDELESNEWVKSIAANNEIDILDLILYGGEELGIIFTSSSKIDLGKNLKRIGKIVQGEDVTFQGKNIENRGWDHFSR